VRYYFEMASRKMTFTLPAEIEQHFVRLVPPGKRSTYVAEAIRERLCADDRLLVEACHMANENPDVRAIETEFDGLIG
jgi:hypothetical protein